MASIADIEQLLESIFERSAARLFRTRVRAVQIERRVERVMERSRSGHGARTTVPAHYRVRLHPMDLADLAPTPDDAQQLAARLADAALAFARGHGYQLPDRPTVAVLTDATLDRGRVRVEAGDPGRHDGGRWPGGEPAKRRAADGGRGVSAPPAPPAGAGSAVVPVEPAAGQPAGLGREPDPGPVDVEPLAGGGIRGDGTRTHVFRRPAPDTAHAVLRVVGRDGRETAVEVDGRPLTLGRSRDNDLVLDDSRVSRHHGRLQARHGTLVYADLGSTNGSLVNGVRVDEIALGLGDRLLVGDTVLVVESLPG